MNAKRAAEGIGLIAVGAVLLANSLGYIEWGVWWNVINLWPLLIVALGIEIIGASTKQMWVRVLSNVVLLGGLAYAVFVMPVGDAGPWNVVTVWPGGGDVQEYEYAEPHDADVERGTAVVRGGVGKLTVTEGERLASADIRSPFGEPRFDATVSGSRADVVVELSKTGSSGVNTASGGDMRVRFDQAVTWDLTIDAGVAELDADLRELELSGLDVKMGASAGTVVLGEPGRDGRVAAVVDVGVSSLTVRLPRGTSVRISEEGGLSALHLGDGFERIASGDVEVWESEEFDDRGAYWDIELKSGVADVRIEWY